MIDHGNEAVTRARKQAAARGRAQGLETGYTVFSYLLAGMAAYGIIGWLIGRAVHVALLFPLGMLFGLGISIGYIIYRFGRHGLEPQGPQQQQQGPQQQRLAQQRLAQQRPAAERQRKEMTG